MVLALAVPDNYPLVLLTTVGLGWLNMYQTMNVGRHRKLSGITYPQVYAEKAEAATNKAAQKFNCAQRAHQNTLETLPLNIFCILFSGLQYPTAATGIGAALILSRVVYTIGYSSGDPAKRVARPAMITGLALQVLATWTAVQLFLASQ
ncbi:hypothetical protein M422DRAFT_218818 [Sphaerobolus stellatus SS14]|nr:hypothetical protein M422DRAFT_218818 [Sphaerobolus stellatus SS14]